MAKVTAPLHSARASGTIAGMITFATKNGKTYVKKYAPPTNPKTAHQVSMRAMMRLLTKDWINLTTSQQTTWNNAYPNTNLAPYHAYLRCNMIRWANRSPPTKKYPAAESSSPGEETEIDAAGGVRHVKITAGLDDDELDNWTMLLFHSDVDIPTPNQDQLIHVQKVQTTTPFTWTHTPLAPGTHYYKIVAASDDGNVDWSQYDEDDAIVT